MKKKTNQVVALVGLLLPGPTAQPSDRLSSGYRLGTLGGHQHAANRSDGCAVGPG